MWSKSSFLFSQYQMHSYHYWLHSCSEKNLQFIYPSILNPDFGYFQKIREFFKRNYYNSLEFWDCSSQDKWLLHNIVDKETKKFNLSLIFPCKSLWDFSWKNECNEILNKWKMMFQASDDKGGNFLELIDNNLNIIELTYSKDKSWVKYFGYLNSLYTRAIML